jgi:peptidoglycan DL-endopeptidase CwlO
MKKLYLKQQLKNYLMRGVVLVVLVVFGLAAVQVPRVQADDYDAQINALRGENANVQSTVDKLAGEADTLQEQVNNLQAQINNLQAQINANIAKQNDLQKQIEDAQKELARQRSILGEAIKTSYVDGQITTIEMLATSKNLSDFVDKEEYHTAVENKIQETLKKITKLQNELKIKKTEIEALLKGQTEQQAQLDASRNQQAYLLNMNQQQQAEYNSKIKDNNSKIKDLEKQRLLANMRNSWGVTYGGDGGYPWGYYEPYSSAAWSCGGPDPWGMCYRECVSYAAWKVYSDGKYMPNWGGVGNAYQWIQNARNAGFEVDHSPRAGDIAIRDRNYSNPYDVGHAMYVEDVMGDGSLAISQYNASLRGEYSTAHRSADGLWFITFPNR